MRSLSEEPSAKFGIQLEETNMPLEQKPPRREAATTGSYAMSNGGLTMVAGVLTMWYSRLDPSAKPEQLTLVMGSISFILNLVAKLGRDLYAKHFGPQSLTVAALFLVLVVGCASDMTPRQQFYMAAVGWSGTLSAANAYLKTPYAEDAPRDVLIGIDQAMDEGTATLERIRPLIPAQGQEAPALTVQLIGAGLDTLDSITRRLSDIVYSPDSYKETPQ